MAHRRILVTGGCGYIGSVLVRRLLECGYDPVVLDLMIHGDGRLRDSGLPVTLLNGDVRDTGMVRAAASGCWGAVLLAGVSLGNQATPESLAINRQALPPLLDCLDAAGVRRVVYASSCSVYGGRSATRLDESAEPRPNSEYGAAKLDGERMVLAAPSGREPVIVRAATVCGVSPRQRLDLLVNRMVRSAFFHQRIEVECADSIRPSVHLDDLADIYCLLLAADSSQVAGRVFNAAFENRTVRDTALMIRSLTGATISSAGGAGDGRSYVVESRHLTDGFGFRPRRSVVQAASQLLAWFAARPGVDAYAPGYDNRLAEQAWFAAMSSP